jgi:hypothetical protein
MVNKKQLVLLNIKYPEPKLLSREVKNTLTYSRYKHKDGRIEQIITMNSGFANAMKRQRDYERYYKSHEYYNWLRPMTYREWQHDMMEFEEYENQRQQYMVYKNKNYIDPAYSSSEYSEDSSEDIDDYDTYDCL